jgi:O-antigen/teichoic acid export membrane protein
MSRAVFFRQSGWMMIAAVIGGLMMMLVHLLSKWIPEAEYAAVGTLITMAMVVPSGPLQMVFTQQTAAALALGRTGPLTGLIRKIWLGLTVLWLVFALVLLVLQPTLVANWKLSNPASLWATALVVLGTLWSPLFMGVLQGQQNFLWLGWAAIISGVARIGFAALFVLVLGGWAAGIMTGAALAGLLTVGVAIWQSRGLWSAPAEAVEVRGVLRQAVPLMLGFGACQFLFSADTMFVKAWFPDDTAPYVTAGTMSRALMWLVMPLAAVMFPKLVQSSVRNEKTDVMGLTLAGTALLGLGGLVGLWVLGPYLIPIVWPPEFVGPAMKIVPWYAGAMIPLSLANVLVNDLLARSRFAMVPWLVLVALGYVVALQYNHGSFVAVLQTLALACTVLFAICAGFRWGWVLRRKPVAEKKV